MLLSAWQVPSLPRVECYLPPSVAPRLPLRHLGSRVREEPLPDGRRMGDTVWGAQIEEQRVAVSWDWLEIMPGVVCLLDPSNVLTNLRFVDDRDCYEEPLQAIISVNRLVHQTAWQSVVLETLGECKPLARSAERPRRAARELLLQELRAA